MRGGMARISRQTEALRTAARWSLLLLAAGCAEARRLDVAAGLSVARTLTPGADLSAEPAGLVAIKGRVVALTSTSRWVKFELVEPGPAEPRGAATPVRVAIPLIGPEAAVLGARWSDREVRVVGTVDGLASPPALLVDGPPRVLVLDDPQAATAVETVPGLAPRQERAAESARSVAPLAPSPGSGLRVPGAPTGSGRPVEPPGSPGPRPGAASALTSPPPVTPGELRPAPTAMVAGEGVRAVEHGVEPRPVATAKAAGGRARAVEHGIEARPAPTAMAGPSAECRAARATRATAAATARDVSDRLATCLATRASCRDQIAAARDPLAEVAAAEERVAWLCAGVR